MSIDSHTGLETRSVKQAMLRGWKCRCPNCGEGKMFDKWLKVTPTCSSCGEELYHERAQDFPPYITIFIVGHVIVTILMLVEARWELSLMAHLLIWIPLGLAMCLAIMQPVKGAVVGMQWAVRMFGFGGEPDEVSEI